MLLIEIRSEPSAHATHLMAIKEKLKPFVEKLIKKNDGKATQDVTRQMYHLFAIHDIDVEDYIQAYEAGEIFDASVLLKGGDLFNEVAEEYRDLAKELYGVRSTGLGTPNAASGEGELMALMMSPDVGVAKKQNRGDLTVKGKFVELKGNSPRVFGKNSGAHLNSKALELCKKYNIQPSTATKGRPTVSVWDTGRHETFWNEQFETLGEDTAIKFLTELMNETGADFTEDSIKKCFRGGKFSATQLQKEIVKALFSSTKKEWDYLTVIIDGKVQAVPNSNEDFAKAVDTGKIVPHGNFFRMFQQATVGWYYRFSISPDTPPEESKDE